LTGGTAAVETTFSQDTDSAVDQAIAYFNRQTERADTREKIKELYGRGIKTSSNTASGETTSKDTLETYERNGFTIQVDEGMIETVPLGFGHKIIAATATLFTEKGQKYNLKAGENDNPEKAEEFLRKQRKNGGYQTTIVRADEMAVKVGSSAVLTSYADGNLDYQHIAPSSIRAIFGDTITNDEGETRAAKERDIEDASAVIIKLSETEDAGKWNYLAIFGRSEPDYPNGRYVQYKAGDTLEVPEPGDTEIVYEYLHNDAPANPLSVWANEHPDEAIPEYPLRVFYGGESDEDTTFPITTSLYSNCLEISAAGSHTLSAAQEAATGTKVIERDNQAAGKPLPRSLTGAVSLQTGQRFRFEAHDSAACKAAYEVMRMMMVDIASSYSVPDFMAVSNEHMLDSDSGEALKVKQQPQILKRNKRAEENERSVRGLFVIEKCLLKMFYKGPDQGAVDEIYRCELDWYPGELSLPEDKTKVMDRVDKGLKNGMHDVISGLREVHELGSDEEAIDLYEKMKERASKYPPLGPAAQKPKLGLPGRVRGGAVNGGQNQDQNGTANA
jgi:hypothetical protein